MAGAGGFDTKAMLEMEKKEEIKKQEKEYKKEKERKKKEEEEAKAELEEVKKEMARETANPDLVDAFEMRPFSDAEFEYLEKRLRQVPADPGVALDRWVLIAHAPTIAPAPPPALDADPDAPPPLPPPPIPSPLLHRSLPEVWSVIPALHDRVMKAKGSNVWRSSDEERIRTKISEIDLEAHTLSDAIDMSKKERADEMMLDEFWSYAEIDIGFFAGLLMKLKRVHGHFQRDGIGTYVDCGSGLGKTCMAACLMHSFERCMGIEGLNSLVDGAQVLLERFQSTTYPMLSEKEQEARQGMELSFAHDDFFADDTWLAGTCVYIDLTCFNPMLVARFVDFSQELSHGTVLISLSKKLVAVHLFLLWEEEAETSWGTTRVYVYERKPPPEELEKFLKGSAEAAEGD